MSIEEEALKWESRGINQLASPHRVFEIERIEEEHVMRDSTWLHHFILIDNPPGKAMLAFNGLAAADLILIPSSAERMAVDGVADLITHVQKIMWSKFSLTHQELRILFTMYRSTTSHSPAIVANAKKIWRDNVLNVKIPHATIFSR